MANDADVVKYFGGKNPQYVISVDPSSNQPMIVGKDPKNPSVALPYYLYVQPNGKNFSVSKSLDAVLKAYTKDFQAAKSTQSVWDAMLASGDVSKKQHDTKDAAAWYKGLAKFVTSYGVGQVDAANNGAKSFTPFNTWFKKAASGTGGSGTDVRTTTSTRTSTDTTTSKDTSISTSTDVSKDTSKETATTKTSDTGVSISSYLSSQAEADNEINAFFMEQLGRNATIDERKAYLELLNTEEAKMASTRTATSSAERTTATEASKTATSEASRTATSEASRTATSATTSTGTTTSTAVTSGTSTTGKTSSASTDKTSGTSASKTSTTSAGQSSTATEGTSATTATGTSRDTTTTVGPGNLTAADHTRIMSGLLATAIKNTSTEDLMKAGGSVAQSISTLQAYAGDFGLRNYTADLAKSDLASRLAEGAVLDTATIDSERLKIRAMAKSFYPGLASLIDQGVKVSSIGNIYANEMQRVLELPAESIDWANDNYISKALQNKGMDGTSQGKDGTLNLNDFTIMLRNDPRWSKTKNAREEAAGYANEILRAFGLAG